MENYYHNENIHGWGGFTNGRHFKLGCILKDLRSGPKILTTINGVSSIVKSTAIKKF